MKKSEVRFTSALAALASVIEEVACQVKRPREAEVWPQFSGKSSDLDRFRKSWTAHRNTYFPGIGDEELRKKLRECLPERMSKRLMLTRSLKEMWKALREQYESTSAISDTLGCISVELWSIFRPISSYISSELRVVFHASLKPG